jgi:hypothetical protein
MRSPKPVVVVIILTGAVMAGVGGGVSSLIAYNRSSAIPSGFSSSGRPSPSVASTARGVATDLQTKDERQLALAGGSVPDAAATLRLLGGHPTSVVSIHRGEGAGDVAVTYTVSCTPLRHVSAHLSLDWESHRWTTSLYGPPLHRTSPADVVPLSTPTADVATAPSCRQV